MATESEAAALGFALPQGTDSIRDGDDAIRQNATAAVDLYVSLNAKYPAAVDAATRAEAAAELAEAISGLTGEDDAVALLVNTPTSDTAGALSATYGRNPAQVAREVAARMTGKRVVLIFRHDDLQQSQLNFLDEYAARGVKASFLVPSDYLDDGTHLTTTDMIAIHDAGHEIGSHSKTHTLLSSLTPEQRRVELLDSKKAIEAKIGGGYVCETFAYPGNVKGADEIMDYYIGGAADGAAPAMNGPFDLYGFPASLGDADWADDASIAATTTKATNRIAALKAMNDGTSVDVIQIHNEVETSDEQLAAILDVALADPEVVILTFAEWCHYVRAYYSTINGRHYWRGPRAATGYDVAVKWNSDQYGSGPFVADKLGSAGAGFRALTAGVEQSHLDDHLMIAGRGTTPSTFERGHPVKFYSPDMTRSVELKTTNGALMQFLSNGGTVDAIQYYQMGIRVQKDGPLAFAVKSLSGTDNLVVDTTRGTMKLRNLASDPASPTVGEIALVNGVMKVCATAGVWTVVGTQT